ALGVADDPLPERDRALINIYEFFNREMTGLEDHSALVRGASRFFERHLLEGIFRHYGHLKGFHFYIPPSLQGRWGLEA
ncbi:MAG: hypothetical protein MI919_31460, partial [Holophagales bacterium]|nr:hypothetical protein [Holophagales bacterium]